jgi:F0F1-type ATP synthase assembly protein I
VATSRIARFARGGALAFEFSGTIGGGAICGWGVDRWFGTEPWGLMVFSVVGVVGGFLRLLQFLRRFEAIDRAER